MAGIPVNRGGWHTHVYVEVVGIPVDRCGWHTLGQRNSVEIVSHIQ